MLLKANSFAELYLKAVKYVYVDFENILAPRGMRIRECCNVLLELTDPTNNLFTSSVRPYPKRYLAGELYWYFTARNDLKFIQQYSKFWASISDDNKTCNSAYGHLLWDDGINEWKWAYDALWTDKDTRQAIMHFNKPYHMVTGTKDFPCTLTGTFQIRQNKLNFMVVMRSTDIVKGLTFDMPFFSILQQQMFKYVVEYYPLLQLGTLSLFTESLHLYDTDNLLARKMIIKNDCHQDALPVLNNDIINPKGVIIYDKYNTIMKWICENDGMPIEAKWIFD